MSASKANYPFRSQSERPKKPSKGVRKPSRTSGGGKRKSWVSEREAVSNNMDAGRRQNFAWWRSPLYKQNRLIKASRERVA